MDTLTHELYGIQQSSHESVYHYAMRLNFASLELSSTFHTTMPQRRIKEVHKTRFLGGLRENIETAVSCKSSIDHRDDEVTYRELTKAVRKKEASLNLDITNDLTPSATPACPAATQLRKMMAPGKLPVRLLTIPIGLTIKLAVLQL